MTLARPLIALAFAALGGCAGPETLQASFDHSEWHQPAMLRLDVASGGFVAEFRDGTHATGRFSSDETRQIQTLVAAAHSSGFADPTCGAAANDGNRRIVVSNGGQQTLVLDGRGDRLDAPVDMGCWTPEADALHAFVNRTLYARGDDWRMPRQRLHFGLAG
jgi:hypothetical protein